MQYRQEAIEDVAAAIHRARRHAARCQTGENAANVGGVGASRLFGMLLGLLNPQVRHLIQLHGLSDRREEARVVCVAAVRAALNDHAETGGSFGPLVSLHLRHGLHTLAGAHPTARAA